MKDLDTSKLKRIARFPTRLDAVFLIAMLVFPTAILCAFVRDAIEPFDQLPEFVSIFPVCSALAAALVASGAAIGIKSFDRVGGLLILLLFAFAFVLFFIIGPLAVGPALDIGQQQTEQVAGLFFLGATQEGVFSLVGALIAILPLTIGGVWVTRGFLWLGKRYWKRVSAKRLRSLLEIACSLFVLHLIANFIGRQFAPINNTMGLVAQVVVSGLMLALSFLVGVYLIAKFFRSNVNPWIKFALIVVVSICNAVYWTYEIANWYPSKVESISSWASFALAPPCYLLSLMAVTRQSKIRRADIVRENDEANVQIAALDPNAKPRYRFSRLGLVLSLIGTSVLGWLYWSYDPGTIVSSNKPAWEAFELGKLSRTVSRQSNGSIRIRTIQDQSFFWIRLEENSPEDILKIIGDTESKLSPNHLMIEGVSPAIDFSVLPSQAGFTIGLSDGSLSDNQMKDLCSIASFLGFEDVELPGTFDESYPLPGMSMGTKQNSSQSRFLKSYLSSEKYSPPWISIQHQLSLDEWKALEDCNTKAVNVTAVPSTEVLRYRSGKSQSHIQLYLSEDPFEDKELMNFILDGDAELYFYHLAPARQSKLALATGRLGSGIRYAETPSTDETFVKWAKKWNWSYAWDEQGNITKIWFGDYMYYDRHVKALGELTVLRLDRRGIDSNVWMTKGVQDGQTFTNFPKLERLYLATSTHYNDLRFLARMPKLKFLQIQSQDRTVQPGSGFEKCLALEKLVSFGTPDKKSWAELRTLKSLKQLVLIDDDGDFPLPADVKKVEKLLPGVSIEVVQSENYKPDLDDEFKEHLSKIRKQVEEFAGDQ